MDVIIGGSLIGGIQQWEMVSLVTLVRASISHKSSSKWITAHVRSQKVIPPPTNQDRLSLRPPVRLAPNPKLQSHFWGHCGVTAWSVWPRMQLIMS